MDNINKFCLYLHKNSFTLEVFYVGIGTGYRPLRRSGRSKWWNRYVNKYGFISEVIKEGLTWEGACKLETEYIIKYGRLDLKKGALVNMTDGGDGTPNCKWNIGKKRSDETRKRLSDANKGRPPSISCQEARKSAGHKGWNKGIPMTEEAKEKLRQIRTGKKSSEETRKKISNALKGRVFSEETKRKNSEALKGRVFTEEHKKNVSIASKKAWEIRKQKWEAP